MNYYNYSVAAIIVQTEICNNEVRYLIKLFVRCSLILSHWSILDNVVVIDMSVYMSVAARNECICLYRYCSEG